MRYLTVACAAVVLVFSCGVARAQPSPPGDYVRREEYDKLKKEFEQMKADMATMRKERATGMEGYASKAEVDQAMDEFDKSLRQIKDMAQRSQAGEERLVIVGDAAMDFVAQKGSKSTLSASMAPIILWKLSDRLMFEGAFDIGISTSEDVKSSTSFDLVHANITYLVNKYVTAGGGLFLVPFGVFRNHYDSSWINKLPDPPLAFGDSGIAPGSELGVFAEGAFPVGTMKVNYAVYLTNGPNLITKDPATAGMLNFADYTDLNNNKAGGGRIGFQPIPEMELGYSIMFAQVDSTDFPATSALIQAVDLQYKKEYDLLKGTIDLRAEWVWSNVDQQTFDPTGKLGFGPLSFDNYRNGGYVQISYRPTQFKDKIIRNIEPVFRYDRLEVSKDAPGGGWEQRYAIGLDYWLRSNAVIKVAYEFDDRQVGDNADAFMLEFGIGL